MVKRDIFPKSVRQNHKSHQTNKLLLQCNTILDYNTITGPAPYSLRKSIQYLVINGHKISTLIDSGSSESFIHQDVVRKLSITITKCTGND